MCMGERGRDHLASYFGDCPLARQIIEAIQQDGYCVLPSVFTAQEMDVELDRAWDFVQTVSPTVRRNDWSTWLPSQGSPDPWPHAQRDMMQLHQAGWLFSGLREQFAERVFEPLYGTRELHVSKDGFTFQRPTDGELGRTPNDHFDQGSRWMGLQCIQGSVALTDQTENDGCFKVWPGSHKYREEILSHPKHGKAAARTDFIIIHEDDKDLLRERGVEPRRVPVKRGDVVLWRSDVCHCGAPPLGKCDTYRTVAYVCCLPAALTMEPVYPQKQRAYERLETGCHYPSREEWFETTARHMKMPWRPYFKTPPKLTRRQQELYGLMRYGGPGEGADETKCLAKAEGDKRQPQNNRSSDHDEAAREKGTAGDRATPAAEAAAPPQAAPAPLADDRPTLPASQAKGKAAPQRRWAKR